MRLTTKEISTIKQQVKNVFGYQAQVYLFGSRVDNEKRGGDIDLFIKGAEEEKYSLENKIRFLVEVKKEIGDQKIDVVFDNESTRQRMKFYNSVQKSKVLL